MHPEGFEPSSSEPKSDILSVELQVLLVTNYKLQITNRKIVIELWLSWCCVLRTVCINIIMINDQIGCCLEDFWILGLIIIILAYCLIMPLYFILYTLQSTDDWGLSSYFVLFIYEVFKVVTSFMKLMLCTCIIQSSRMELILLRVNSYLVRLNKDNTI